MFRVPRTFWVLLILGLALRLTVIQLRPLYALPHAPDEREYYLLAYNVAHGAGFSMDGQPTAYRSLLLPAVGSLLIRVFGPSPRPLFLLQALLSTLTGWLIYLLAARRFGKRAGLFAAGIWLLYPSAILSSALYVTTTLFTFLWTLGLTLYDRLEAYGYRWRDAVGLGLVTGLVALSRSVGLLLFIGLFFYLLFIRYQPWWETQWRSALVVLAGCLIVVLPWMTRNLVAVGSFSVNTNAGLNLIVTGRPTMSRDQADLRGTQDLGREHPHQVFVPLSDSSLDYGAGREDSVFAQPGLPITAGLWTRKLARLWSTDALLWARYLMRDAPAVTIARIRRAPVALLMLAALPSFLVASLGFSGFGLVRRFPTRGLYVLVLGLTIVAIFFTYGLPRDLFSLFPLLLIGCAAYLRRPPWPALPLWRRAVVLGVVAGLTGLWIAGAFLVASW